MSRQYSPSQLDVLDRRVREILEEARQRAAGILAEQRTLVETLRDTLLDQKVIEAKALSAITKTDAQGVVAEKPES